ADRARISGIFEMAATPALAALLEDAGIETEENELLVEREILANGKSRAFVGNRPATAALLKELGPHLGDIHGQHDQQQLFSPAVQRDTPHQSATAPVDEIASIYQTGKQATAELEELDRTSQEKLRLADLWSFQLKEIESVDPKSGEDTDLENERRILRNVVRL